MANRRMLAKSVVRTDKFIDMPHSSQLLYVHLAIEADDEGFVANPKTIMRTLGFQDDNFTLLIAKGYIIPFESGICVVKHWLIHNYIQKDRRTETTHTKEKALIGTMKDRIYIKLEEAGGIELLDENDSHLATDQQPDWLGNRKKQKEASELPYSFEYRIRGLFWGKICPICGVEMRDHEMSKAFTPTVQHCIPFSKGGRHELSNIAVVCRSCNSKTRDKITGLLNNEEVKQAWATLVGPLDMKKKSLGKRVIYPKGSLDTRIETIGYKSQEDQKTTAGRLDTQESIVEGSLISKEEPGDFSKEKSAETFLEIAERQEREYVELRKPNETIQPTQTNSVD